MKYILLIVAAVFLFVNAAQAQTRTITGRVVSADKAEALPGVTIVVKGTTNGISTDVDGGFTLQVPDKQDVTLVVSYLSYKAQELGV